MAHFNRSIAIIIGINQYQNGVPPLTTAVNDASDLSQVLKADHGYQVVFMRDHQVTLASLKTLLVEKLPTIVQPSDRVLFYFAGHGLAFNGDAGPEGYLIPQDATLGDSKTYLPMTLVHDSLTALACRHFLGIFDCCFAGAFRWSATRRLTPIPQVIHKERFDRFLTDPAWQVLTSAADDQEAMDALSLKDHRGHTGHHSPFAEALIQALKAESQADASPPAQNGKPAGDGVITATELYQYLRDAVETGTLEHAKRQTPGLWPLKKHGKGEYIFLVPGRKPDLPEAPKLDEAANPYRGLESFEEVHQHLFFGRKQLIQELQEFVESHALTVVLGASGTGKSSVVKAGLVPALKQNLDIDGNPIWQVLPIVRPGVTPLKAVTQVFGSHDLGRTLDSQPASAWGETLKTYLQQWQQQHSNQKLLLVIDQAEELFSLCREGAQRQQFLAILAELLEQQNAQFHILLTLRSDFEPQFRDSPLEPYWGQDRFLIRPMNREELRAAIEAPASAKVMYFDPPELVDRLIDEVNEMPGALPLLSFTLRELFLKYLRNASTRSNRAITEADYEELGGIKQALVNRAEEEYRALVEQDPAFADTVRHVMLRMVATGGTGNTRRQVLLSELDYAEPEGTRVKEALARYKQARLLVSDTTAEEQPYVEPAHDALVEGWPRLLQWLESGTEAEAVDQKRRGLLRWLNNLRTKDKQASLDEREKLLLQRRLTPAANDWQREQKTEFLWHADARLPLLKQIRGKEPDWFNRTEGEFVKRSLGRKRFNVRLRWIIILNVLAISIFAAFFGNWLRVRAVKAEEQAEGRRIEAEKRSVQNLVSSSKTNFESDQHLDALLDALGAARVILNEGNISIRADDELVSLTAFALHRAFYGNREIMRLPSNASAISPRGAYIATVDKTHVRVWSNAEKKYAFEAEHGFSIDVQAPDYQHLFEISFNPDETVLLISKQENNGNSENKMISNSWYLDGRKANIHNLEKEIIKFSPAPDFVFTQTGLLRLSDLKKFEFSNLKKPDEPKYERIFFSPDAQKIAWENIDGFKVADLKEIDEVMNTSEIPFASNKDKQPGMVGRDLLGFITGGNFLLSQQYSMNTSTLPIYEIWDLDGKLMAVSDRDLSSEGCQSGHGIGLLSKISPGGNFLFFECSGGSVVLRNLDFEDNELVDIQNENEKVPFDLSISDTEEINLFSLTGIAYDNSATVSSFDDAQWLVSNSEGSTGVSKLWTLKKDPIQIPDIYDAGDESIVEFDVSPDGSIILAVTSAGNILLWNKPDTEPKQIHKLALNQDLKGNPHHYEFGPEDTSPSLAIAAFSPFNNNIALGTSNIVYLFDQHGNKISSIQHEDMITGLDFNLNYGVLVSASIDGVLKFSHPDGTFLQEMDTGKLIGTVEFSPIDDIISIAYSKNLPNEYFDPELQAGGISIVDMDGTEMIEFEVPETPYISKIDFLADGNIISSGHGQYFRTHGGRGVKIINAQDGRLTENINISSSARHISLHPRQKLLSVEVASEPDSGVTNQYLWHTSGEILSDYSHLNFGWPAGPFTSNFLNKRSYGKFNSSGNVFAAQIPKKNVDFQDHKKNTESHIAVWSFDLQGLADKSCELLSNYLSEDNSLATDEQRALCQETSNPDSGDGEVTEAAIEALKEKGALNRDELGNLSGNLDITTSTPWYSLSTLQNRWRQIRQSASFSEASDKPFTAFAPMLDTNLDLSGLGLSLSEQKTFYQLHTQTTAWDVQGALDTLAVLQASDNTCVESFATEFSTVLNEQGNNGFRQITPIKEQLNETQGCTLPLVPFEFSPLSGN